MGRAKSNLKKKPEDNPFWFVFTPREQRIIKGIPTGKLHRHELRELIRKAENLYMEDVAESICELYEALTADLYPAKYTIEEAQAVLQSLTPWER